MKRASTFGNNVGGSVAVTTAFASLLIMGSAALAIDIGSFYFRERRQQSATDLAAIVAASDIANARSAAIATLSRNGYDPSALQNVEYGTYTADMSIAPAQRFVTSQASVANAVRLTVRSTTPMLFGSIFLIPSASAATQATGTTPAGGAGASAVTIKTKAVAAKANFASLAIGSRLASLNAGLLNDLLGKLLGGNVALTLMDYQSIASANIDMFTFSTTLATRVGLTAVTFDNLASATVRVGDVLGALADTARATGQSTAAVAALTQIAAAKSGSFDTLSVSGLLNYGPFGGMPATTSGPMAVAISALDVLMATAEIAGKNSLIDLTLGLTVPGITSATLQLGIGERPVGASFATMGTTGVTVSTAQTRMLLTVTLAGTAPIATVSLPIYLQLAAATATLQSLQCGPSATAPSLTLGVTPSVAEAWIGTLSNSDFLAFGAAPSVQPATLVNAMNLFTVTGVAHASMANSTATPVSFTAADIAAHTKKTTSTTDFTASLLTSLDGNLRLTVKLGFIDPVLPGLIQQSVAQTIAAATTPIDQVLTQVLQTLGLGIGEADTWVTGVRCNGGVLVN